MTGRTSSWLVAAIPVALLAAAGSGCASEPGPHVVSGTLALSSFPEPIWAVHVVQAGGSVTGTVVAADGTFTLTIPPGQGYRIELVGGSGRPVLVFPRAAGDIEASFAVRGGGTPFDLGLVRYVGDPLSHTYAYLAATGDPAGADVECEDGIDAATGAVCVDDDDEEGAGECDEEEEEEGDDSVDGECVDGFDAVTGAPCVDEDAEPLPAEAAVAEHNLPPELGCGDEEDDD
ncbi:MAG: hypothetical protein HY905_09105 [Deltaproteobacteria bacterium]|nr:hypothetical protein [Deltaproteobacteria bacterium]